jgi:hypothetical protein
MKLTLKTSSGHYEDLDKTSSGHYEDLDAHVMELA